MIKEIKVLGKKASLDRKISYKKIESNKFDYFKISSKVDYIDIFYTSQRSKFYALKRLEQVGKNKVFELTDYADIKTRGVIEGFYSIPWTYEQRMDMLKFMDQVFLNTYIYAPKDDPYHNKKWREKYDLDSLNNLKKLVDLARKLDIDFVWAIHPGMNKFDFNKYDKELETLLEKYESLIDIGIKHFALFMDDIDRDEAYQNKNNHKKLYMDVEEFLVKNKLDKLMVVIPYYNQAWVDDKAREYFALLRDTDIEIMWTGRDVLSPIDDRANEFFEKISGKKPNIWLNWPVNDYMRDSIFMEPFEYFNKSRNKTFKSLFTNPMNQEELSKISVYQIAAYLWDMKNYKVKDTIKNAFELVEKNPALYKISNSFYSSQLYKENKNPLISENEEIYESFVKKDFSLLKDKVSYKIKQVNSYLTYHSNDKLYQEIHVFVENLLHLLKAIDLCLNNQFKESDEEFEKTKEKKIWIYKEYTDNELVERKVKNPDRLIEIYEYLRSNQ
ncbi:MAG: beta-N-acetylglucosaminidase domain-containing protein [Peptoniphilaceae bacterium]|nr:beta-N-acetylglucosaminidase domain-containing protein [Peptoniphilaceae bacterium]MDY6019258.1 beta-N-acetylglucosaminidase domain-containing protein [Anaerococcus sp.]